jgi:hypothetical protein
MRAEFVNLVSGPDGLELLHFAHMLGVQIAFILAHDPSREHDRGENDCEDENDATAPRHDAPRLAYAAFEADIDQLLGFHGEFHRQLLDHVTDEAIDDQRDGFLFGNATLHDVELLIL